MNKDIIPLDEDITNMIFTFRNQQVMIDKELARLYGIKTFRFNEQVKRNVKRFEGYIFQLTDEEKQELIAKCDRFNSLKHSTSNPYVFNEHGVLMLASIFNSDIAISVNRKIIKVFVEIRKLINVYPEYELLKEKIKRLETSSEVIQRIAESTELNQKVDSKLMGNKINDLSSKVFQLSKILDEFQNSYVVVKRPEDNDKES